MAKKSKQREGGKADRAWDKKHPGAKEGSKKEEAFDRKMGFKKGSK